MNDAATNALLAALDPTTHDAAIAAHIATHVQRALVAHRTANVPGRSLGDSGDQLAHGMIVAALSAVRPHDGILSEEGIASHSPHHAPVPARRWIVDPLDGTREYSEGRSDWAVHIALSRSGGASVGAVAVGSGALYRSDAPHPMTAAANRPRMVVSRTRATDDMMAVAAKLDAETIAMGSAGAKAMAVVRGEAEIYLHLGGQYAWDNCAPAAVALAHGLHASRVDGAPLSYGDDPLVPDLLIAHPDWAARALEAIRSVCGAFP